MSDSLRISSHWSSENTATAVLMGFPGGSTVQSPSAVQELQEALVQPLGREGPWRGHGTHSSVLAWRTARTEELILTWQRRPLQTLIAAGTVINTLRIN